MNRERLFRDTDWTGQPFRPETKGVLVRGNQGNILTTVFLPGGQGPHPTVIFCHGIPGVERLLEFGSALRQIGFASVHFHYAGSWGSPGSYSLTSCMNDADAIVRYIAENENDWFDSGKVGLVGHSLGGMIAAHAISSHSMIKAGVFITPAQYTYKYEQAIADPGREAAFRRSYDSFGDWVKDFGWDVLKAEISASPDRFRFSSYGKALAKKPILAVAATMDEDVTKEQNYDELVKAIEAEHPAVLEKLILPTNHALCDQRNRLKEALADFFLTHLTETAD